LRRSPQTGTIITAKTRSWPAACGPDHTADEKDEGGRRRRQQATTSTARGHQSFKTLAAPFDGVVTTQNVELGMSDQTGGSRSDTVQVSDRPPVRIYVQGRQSSFSGKGFPVGIEGDTRNAAIPGACQLSRRDAVSYSGPSIRRPQPHAGRDSVPTTPTEVPSAGVPATSFRNPDRSDPSGQDPSTADLAGHQAPRSATLDGNNKSGPQEASNWARSR